MDTKEQIKKIVEEVYHEIEYSNANYANKFRSHHEAYAVILEELDELWYEIKKDGTHERLRKEAIQTTAMLIKFIIGLE